MRVSFKFTHVIMALLMSVAMMFSMTGAATAAGCSNPNHQHAFTLNSPVAMVAVVEGEETIIKSDGFDRISVAENEADNVSIYNSNGSHRVLADSGSGGLLRQSSVGMNHSRNRHVLAVAFKHRSPPDSWQTMLRH